MNALFGEPKHFRISPNHQQFKPAEMPVHSQRIQLITSEMQTFISDIRIKSGEKNIEMHEINVQKTNYFICTCVK